VKAVTERKRGCRLHTVFKREKGRNAPRYAMKIARFSTSKGGAVKFDFDLHYLGERAAKASGVGGWGDDARRIRQIFDGFYTDKPRGRYRDDAARAIFLRILYGFQIVLFSKEFKTEVTRQCLKFFGIVNIAIEERLKIVRSKYFIEFNDRIISEFLMNLLNIFVFLLVGIIF